MKSPVADEKQFCEAAKKYHILIVPGSSFCLPGICQTGILCIL